jgi:hypothetical protein
MDPDPQQCKKVYLLEDNPNICLIVTYQRILEQLFAKPSLSIRLSWTASLEVPYWFRYSVPISSKAPLPSLLQNVESVILYIYVHLRMG